uniref:(northern house mosquito) hypothetical protein n=1 Tax=Culex pipiens TaxID=7175 RepID=A0A8D8AJ54_CULPI
MNRHSTTHVRLKIFPMRCATNCLYLLWSDLIQANTVLESVQKTVFVIGSEWPALIATESLEPSSAPSSSSLGMDWLFSGATFVFAPTSAHLGSLLMTALR